MVLRCEQLCASYDERLDFKLRQIPKIRCQAAGLLRDAAEYIQKLPKAEQLPHWQAAVEALIMAAEGRAPLLHARVGMLRAMNHGVERECSIPIAKRTRWGKRKLKRDEMQNGDRSPTNQ